MTSALSLKFFLLFFVKAGYLKLSFTCHYHFKLGIILTPWKIRKISWNFKILIKLGYLNKFIIFFFLWVKILSWPSMGIATGTPLFIVLCFFVVLQYCGFFFFPHKLKVNATLHQASLSAPFFQQYLLASCLFVTFW